MNLVPQAPELAKVEKDEEGQGQGDQGQDVAVEVDDGGVVGLVLTTMEGGKVLAADVAVGIVGLFSPSAVGRAPSGGIACK